FCPTEIARMGNSRFWIGIFLITIAISMGGCSRDMAKSADRNVADVSGEACSFVHLSRGETFCLGVEGETFVQAPLYCYRSLGNVDCYNEPNPYPNEQSSRIRKVPPLASMGVSYVSFEEYNRLKTEALIRAG